MKLIVFILLFIILFGGLLVYFNFESIYMGLVYAGGFITQAFSCLSLLITAVVEAITEYQLVFVLVVLFVLLWLFHVLLVDLFGGKQ